MNVRKMLLVSSLALAVVAFAAPAAAQAKVQLTAPANVPLPVGAPVTAHSTNLVTTVGANRLTCAEVMLHYKVTVNGPNHVVLDPVNAHNATTAGCQIHALGMTFPTTITEAGAEKLTINTWGTGETKATFTSKSIVNHCSYKGTIHAQGTNKTDLLHVKGKLTALQGGCDEGIMHGKFTVTSNGVPVIADFVPTP